jgi:hypothetical protein
MILTSGARGKLMSRFHSSSLLELEDKMARLAVFLSRRRKKRNASGLHESDLFRFPNGWGTEHPYCASVSFESAEKFV